MSGSAEHEGALRPRATEDEAARPAANHVHIEDTGKIYGDDPQEVAIEFLLRFMAGRFDQLHLDVLREDAPSADIWRNVLMQRGIGELWAKAAGRLAATPPDELFVTVTKAARILNVEPEAVHDLILRKELGAAVDPQDNQLRIPLQALFSRLMTGAAEQRDEIERLRMANGALELMVRDVNDALEAANAEIERGKSNL